MVTWDRLRVFAAVVEHGSVTAAAEALHVTGPGVSQQVHKLEKELGTQLVEPDGRGIRLTSAGGLLASSARQIAATVTEAERDLSHLHGQTAGPLRVGAIASALRTWVSPVLAQLTSQHARLEPSITDGEPEDLIHALRARRLDAALIESWPARPARVPPGIQLTPLITEEAHIAVADWHPLAGRPRLTPTDLDGQAWVSGPPGSDVHKALVQMLRTGNASSDVRYHVADYASQLALVSGNLAIALVPGIARTPAPEAVRFLPCQPAVTRSLAIATPQTTGPAVRAFITALQEQADERP
jgi:DNA-binding transcriptional LysR family regulator